MKKLLLFLLLFSFCFNVKALEVITDVEATSNISDIIEYASVIEKPTFNVSVGEGINFIDDDDASWEYYNGSKWVSVFDGYRFNSGRWRYKAKLDVVGNAHETHTLRSQTTVKVNGEEWNFSYCSSCDVKGTAYSPVFNVDASGNLEFFMKDTYFIYTSFTGVAIYGLDVSSSVEGGTAPYVFSKTSGPDWINVSSTGVISGTPTVIGENDDLVVRVTDQDENYKEITITVAKTGLPPAQRELIELITATSNTVTIPVLNNPLVKPTFNVTSSEGSYFTNYNCGWYKLIGSNWVLQEEGNFTPGKWQYRTQVNLNGDNALLNRLSDDTVVMVDDINWNAQLYGISNESYTLSVNSPEYTIMGTINDIKLAGDIKAPKVGDDIPEIYIRIDSINNNNELVNIADVEASWQYKTGEGFFDWKDASGKFESGKTYHIRLMITITSDTYELANIATFPVTFGNYELTQFQLNNKTVGEFIEFNELKELTAPKLSIKNDNNKVILLWNEQSEASKYRIYKSTDGKKFTKLVDTKDNSYTEKGLTYGKKYYYKVRVYDENGNKFDSNIVNKKIKPNKVKLSIKSAGSNNVKLNWEKVSVTGYEVQRSTDNKKWTKVTTITKNSTLEYNNKKLKENKTYYYKVRAYKTVSGKKIYGSYSEVVSTKTAPVKPSFEVKIKNYDSMNLVIGYAKGTSEYRVYRSLDEKTWERIETLPNEGTLEDAGHTIGTMYYYKVKACNSKGNCSGYVYDELRQSVKTPKITVESTTTKKVKVTIGKVEEAVGYKVYRSTSKNGKYELIKEITDIEELTFNDKTKKGYTYYYKTRAYSRVDGSKVYSPYSGIKKVVSK